MAFAPIINGTYIVSVKCDDEAGTEVDYACQTSEVQVTAEAGDVTEFHGLCEDSDYSAVGPTAWAMAMTYAQDFATGGLARFAYDHDGHHFSGEINPTAGPASATQPSFAVAGRVVAGPIGGGAKGEFATGEVEWPLDGKPPLLSSPPTVMAAEANGKTAKAA